MGGLARKATIIEQLISTDQKPIIVDAGDLFFKKDDYDPGVTLDAAKINAEIIRESFNTMGCDAFSPGQKDFAGGLDFLLDQEDKSDFPYISCNIYDLDDNLLFAPYLIKKIKGKNIGIIGLSSVFTSNKVIVKDPIESINQYISELNSKVDFVLLLFNATQIDLNRLYNRNFEIDMILSSKGRTRSSDGGSKTPTYMAGDRGKILYKFMVNMVDDELPYVDIAWCQNTIKRATGRLDKMKQGQIDVDLYKMYKNDQKTINRIENYQNQIDKANQMLENSINSLIFEKIELDKNIIDRTDILKIVDEGKLKIKDLNLPPMPLHDHDHHHHHSH